jgi:hypothetical protein
MHGFNWYEKPTEGVGFVRALRTHLTNNLPEILPNLSSVVRERIAEMHNGHPVVNGVWNRPLEGSSFKTLDADTASGVKYSPIARMITKTVVLANVVAIFGKDLAKNEAFMEAVLTYTEELVISAEIVRVMPKMLRP